MEGITISLCEMKIHSKLDANHVNERPLRQNPRYKENACQELDQMFEVGIIFCVEEYK